MNWTILPGQKKINTDKNTKLKRGFHMYTEELKIRPQLFSIDSIKELINEFILQSERISHLFPFPETLLALLISLNILLLLCPVLLPLLIHLVLLIAIILVGSWGPEVGLLRYGHPHLQ